MEKRTNNDYIGVWVCALILAAILWLALIAAKATGSIGISWAAALLGCIWIPGIMLAFGVYVIIVPMLALRIKKKIQRKMRKKKQDDRIRKMTIELGIWDKPEVLGGKALTLMAWERFRIKREPGETDAQLRSRCMAAADEELANAPRY